MTAKCDDAKKPAAPLDEARAMVAVSPPGWGQLPRRPSPRVEHIRDVLAVTPSDPSTCLDKPDHFKAPPEERELLKTLRAEFDQVFDSIVGNRHAVERLRTRPLQARMNGHPCNLLFSGSAGVGKSTLARMTSEFLGQPSAFVTGPAVTSVDVFISAVDGASAFVEVPDASCSFQGRPLRVLAPAVIFVDEAHAIRNGVETELLTVLEPDEPHKVFFGSKARESVVDASAITWIFATTHPGGLSQALISRLTEIRLEPITHEECAEIIRERFGNLPRAVCERLAHLGNVPRSALMFARDFVDYAETQGYAPSPDLVTEWMHVREIDEHGLGPLERRLLDVLARSGRPMSIANLAVAVGDDEVHLERDVEPRLIRLGFLERTSRGRAATADGAQHIAGTSNTAGIAGH